MPGWSSSIRCVRWNDPRQTGIKNGFVPFACDAEPAVHERLKLGLSEAELERIEAIDSPPIAAVGPLWAGNPRMAARMGASLDAPEFAQLTDGSQTVVWLGREIGSMARSPSPTVRARPRPRGWLRSERLGWAPSP